MSQSCTDSHLSYRKNIKNIIVPADSLLYNIGNDFFENLSFAEQHNYMNCHIKVFEINVKLVWTHTSWILPCRLGLWNTPTISLQRAKTPLQRVSWYGTNPSDGEVSVMMELWGMQSTPSLPSLPGQLWPGVVSPDRVLYMGQLELNCVLMLN